VYICVFQVRNLELLKLRFGDENLNHCDVMIKDVADSKRINARIMDDLKKDEVILYLLILWSIDQVKLMSNFAHLRFDLHHQNY